MWNENIIITMIMMILHYDEDDDCPALLWLPGEYNHYNYDDDDDDGDDDDGDDDDDDDHDHDDNYAQPYFGPPVNSSNVSLITCHPDPESEVILFIWKSLFMKISI